MSIKIGANLDFRGKDPNFARDQFETLSEMKSISDNAIDEGHISYCKDRPRCGNPAHHFRLKHLHRRKRQHYYCFPPMILKFPVHSSLTPPFLH